MPRTPDRAAGTRFEEKLELTDDGLTADSEGQIVYSGGAFSLRDSVGAFDPRSGGGGITEAQHKALRQLIHFIDDGPAESFASGAFKEQLPAGNPFPTSAIWYTDNTKVGKIVELTVTYNANKTIATEVWKMYDTDGSTVLVTVTDTITYSGIIENTRTRAIA